MEIIGRARREVEKIGDYTVQLLTPYHEEYVVSNNAYFYNKDTGEKYTNRIILYVETRDSEGNILPEEEWVYQKLEGNLGVRDMEGNEIEFNRPNRTLKE